VLTLSEYFGSVYDDGAQIGFMGWSGDYVSAANFIAPHFSCATPAERLRENVSQFCDAPLARSVGAALDGRDPDPVSALAAADRRLVDLAPAVPLTNHRSVIYVSRRVANVQSHQAWFTLLDQLWVR
jgi:ABC-type oligopeptide transport system substrate-binding subunit